MTSMSSGCLLEPATGFAGSLMIMASSLGFVCAFAASDNQSSSVYCSNVLCDGAVVDYCLDRTWRSSCDRLDSCMFGSFVPRLARYGIFRPPSGKRFNYLCDALRGKPSVLAEPVENFFILLRPFVPFGTCGWGSQPHTAIIAVWQLYWLSVSISYVPGALNVS